MHDRYVIRLADSLVSTYLGLFSACSPGDGGVTIKHGSFWMMTSGCKCIVCLFCRRSLHESDEARPFRLRRRPLVPRFCRVPIDGNRKLHAMPECAVKKFACNRVFRGPRLSAIAKRMKPAEEQRFYRTGRTLRARGLRGSLASFLPVAPLSFFLSLLLLHVAFARVCFVYAASRAMSHPARRKRRSRMGNESRRVLTHVRAATSPCHPEERPLPLLARLRADLSSLCRLYRSDSRFGDTRRKSRTASRE